MFTDVRVFPGITHITDSMGVSFTLIEGEKRAILFDTGYGMEDVAAHVKTLTGKPLKVLLSHGHHDHMLGARWFSKAFLCEEDMDEFRERTGEIQRRKVMRQAEERNVTVPDDFMEAEIRLPEAIVFPDNAGGFRFAEEELGGITAQVIHVPGHTPGSIVIHVPEYHLLLTGDDWNPCTWMWFPTSLPANVWRDTMLRLIRYIEEEKGSIIRHVLCSHQTAVRSGEELRTFLSYLSDERIRKAPAVDMNAPVNTHRILKEPEGWTLIFDMDKI